MGYIYDTYTFAFQCRNYNSDILRLVKVTFTRRTRKIVKFTSCLKNESNFQDDMWYEDIHLKMGLQVILFLSRQIETITISNSKIRSVALLLRNRGDLMIFGSMRWMLYILHDDIISTTGAIFLLRIVELTNFSAPSKRFIAIFNQPEGWERCDESILKVFSVHFSGLSRYVLLFWNFSHSFKQFSRMWCPSLPSAPCTPVFLLMMLFSEKKCWSSDKKFPLHSPWPPHFRKVFMFKLLKRFTLERKVKRER